MRYNKIRKKGFLYPDYKSASIEDADTVILPVCYEKTTSYGKGTINAPQTVIDASSYLEIFDEETPDNIFGKVCTLDYLKFENIDKKTSLNKIYEVAHKLVKSNKRIISIGGEHSISYPLVKAHQTYKNLCVLQLDAHADMRETYEGTKYSHACVINRIAKEFPVTQVGIRSISKKENDELIKYPIKTFWAHKIYNSVEWMPEAIDSLSKNVYLTIDVDVFDPSIMPSTGTPEPGGLGWYSVINFIKLVSKNRNIVGVDIVELSPIKNLIAPDFMIAKLIFKIICMINKK